MIKWTEADVIKAFEEAMAPTGNNQGANELLKQLTDRLQGQTPIQREEPPLAPR